MLAGKGPWSFLDSALGFGQRGFVWSALQGSAPGPSPLCWRGRSGGPFGCSWLWKATGCCVSGCHMVPCVPLGPTSPIPVLRCPRNAHVGSGPLPPPDRDSPAPWTLILTAPGGRYGALRCQDGHMGGGKKREHFSNSCSEPAALYFYFLHALPSHFVSTQSHPHLTDGQTEALEG